MPVFNLKQFLIDTDTLDTVVIESTRLADERKDRVVIESTRLADERKDTVVVESTRLADERKDTVVVESTRQESEFLKSINNSVDVDVRLSMAKKTKMEMQTFYS